MKNDFEYLSCNYLENGLAFGDCRITCCDSLTKGPVFCDNFTDKEMFDWKVIQSKREQIIQQVRNGIIPEACKGCNELKKTNRHNNNKLNKLVIDNWRHCNCGCVYCSNINTTYAEFLNSSIQKSSIYSILPILTEIVNKNLIAEDCTIYTVGGEPAVLDEFDDIVRLLSKVKYKEFGILSSGIKFINSLENALKNNNNICLTVSLDCGNAQLYKKIKRIDAFDICIKNLKKYALLTKGTSNKLLLKYIIFENFNDDTKSVDEFLQVALDIGVIDVCFTIEFCQALKCKKGSKIPEQYYLIFDYAKKQAKKLGLRFCTIPIIESLFEAGYY